MKNASLYGVFGGMVNTAIRREELASAPARSAAKRRVRRFRIF